MISSPTAKGVMLIGGKKHNFEEYSSDILELSGDSKETLEWKILDQKLQHPRYSHVSFSISKDIAATLTMKSIESPVQNYFWFLKNLLFQNKMFQYILCMFNVLSLIYEI